MEIVDFPMKHGDFPVRYVNVYQAGYSMTIAGQVLGNPEHDPVGPVRAPRTGHIWRSPKMEAPRNHPYVERIFHHKTSILRGTKTSMDISHSAQRDPWLPHVINGEMAKRKTSCVANFT